MLRPSIIYMFVSANGHAHCVFSDYTIVSVEVVEQHIDKIIIDHPRSGLVKLDLFRYYGRRLMVNLVSGTGDKPHVGNIVHYIMPLQWMQASGLAYAIITIGPRHVIDNIYRVFDQELSEIIAVLKTEV